MTQKKATIEKKAAARTGTKTGTKTRPKAKTVPGTKKRTGTKTAPKQKKAKRSFSDHLINVVCLLVLGIFLINEFAHLHKPAEPMREATALYEKHYSFSAIPPFANAYYLLKPVNYDPRYKYPIVLVLHGVGNYAHAGYYLAHPSMQKAFPSFVIAPMISKRSFWAMPDNKKYQLQSGGLRYPDAIPTAIGAVKAVTSQYSIDPDRIYLTGSSMGAVGTYGALMKYPNLFAAAISIDGMWDPAEASRMPIKTPLWAFHGSNDKKIPAKFDAAFLGNIVRLGGNPIYTEIPNGGHGSWQIAYTSMDVWRWLFKQRRGQ